MKGPCLCGDPYCPSCGNPELEKFEAAEEALYDKLNEIKAPLWLYDLLIKIAEPLMEATSLAIRDQLEDERASDSQYMDYLESQLDIHGIKY